VVPAEGASKPADGGAVYEDLHNPGSAGAKGLGRFLTALRRATGVGAN
jgi:hypothetical protein